jgi:hypothetical protein
MNVELNWLARSPPIAVIGDGIAEIRTKFENFTLSKAVERRAFRIGLFEQPYASLVPMVSPPYE